MAGQTARTKNLHRFNVRDHDVVSVSLDMLVKMLIDKPLSLFQVAVLFACSCVAANEVMFPPALKVSPHAGDRLLAEREAIGRSRHMKSWFHPPRRRPRMPAIDCWQSGKPLARPLQCCD